MSEPANITRYTPEGLCVRLDELAYAHQPCQAPTDRSHMFTYHLTIHNQSQVRVQILARKWILTYEDGEVDVIEGDRVVGKTPVLEPGEAFSYASFHLVGRNGTARGAFHGIDAEGRSITVPIPPFALCLPEVDL